MAVSDILAPFLIILGLLTAIAVVAVGWGIAWRIFFSRFALVRELFGHNENDKKSATERRKFSNRLLPRDGLKQRRTKETNTIMSSKIHEHGKDVGSSTTNQELLIVDEPQPTAATSTLNSEEIEEFFSITNANVKDVKKPKNAVLETFDPLNSQTTTT